MKQRILWHVLFWIVYTLVYAYLNTSFPAPSDLEYSWPMRYWRFWQSEMMILPLKMIATYTFLYWIIPRYILTKYYLQGVLALVILLLPILVLSRLMTYHVVYPFLYGELPAYEWISIRRMLYSLLDIASAMTVASTLALLRRRLEAQRREEVLEKEKLQSELNFLRARIHPHFLFNTLNNIYALARKQSEQTAPVVMQLSHLLRFMLYECNEPEIPLSREVKVIQDFIDLEQLRYNDRLTIDFEQKLDDPEQPIVPLLLLPLVENAFKYGVSETRFDAAISISIVLNNWQLTVHIQNAQASDTQQEREGIGLKSVQRQLDLSYPARYKLDILNENEQYILHLTLDLNLPSR